MVIQKKVLVLITSLLSVHAVQSMNRITAYDTLCRPVYAKDRMWQCAFYAEAGVQKAKAYADDGLLCNVLHIWQKEQNALSMLNGFDETSAINMLRTRLNAVDDGVRGHLSVSGDLHVPYAFAVAAQINFLHYFSCAIYMPYMGMELSNVRWCDKTQDITDADRRVKGLLTNTDSFFDTVCFLSGGLELGGWKRSGFGDLTVLCDWQRHFVQHKPMLKDVYIDARCGLSFPTGKRTDEDKVLALPFGNDGAVGLIFGLGIQVQLGAIFKSGVDVELMHLFDSMRERRIKTDPAQTEFLLLQKAEAHKDHGLTQRFNLHIEADKFYKGLSCTAGYQYYKRGTSTLSLRCTEFSTTIANTAQALQEYTLHQAIVKMGYDFSVHLPDDSVAVPHVAVYARIPFNGKRSVQQPIVGVLANVDF